MTRAVKVNSNRANPPRTEKGQKPSDPRYEGDRLSEDSRAQRKFKDANTIFNSRRWLEGAADLAPDGSKAMQSPSTAKAALVPNPAFILARLGLPQCEDNDLVPGSEEREDGSA